MQCKKCGTDYNETDVFCSSCGEPVSNNNVVEEKIEKQIVTNEQLDNNISESEQPINDLSSTNDNTFSDNSIEIPVVNENDEENTNQTETNEEESVPFVPEPVINNDNASEVHEIKPKSSGKVLWIIIGIISILFVISIVLYFVLKEKKNVMTCTSNTGTIVIKYTNKKIVDYTIVDGISFDVKENNKIIKSKGIDYFISQYNNWFSTNKFGTCDINGEPIKQEVKQDKNSKKNIEVKEVGDEERGYIDIPTNWNNFVDVSGASALQYSYANIYIVSIDVVKDLTYNAEQVAKIYMNSKKQDTSISNIQGTTVTIGKNRKYTAYQVGMIYPSENKTLVTYWFDAEDGKVHYIGLEGPEKLEENNIEIGDFISIPESFRLKN